MDPLADDLTPTSESEADVADARDGDVAVDPTGPSGVRLAATSIGAFIAIVLIGGLIGLLVGNDGSDVESEVASVAITAPSLAPATTTTSTPAATPTTAGPTTVTPTAAIPTTVTETQAEPVLTVDDVEINEPQTVVRGVVELDLPIAPGEAEEAASEQFLELPKAVYDRFSLQVNEPLVIDISANDKIGGVFQSVELTGLGELAPGFVLAEDGTLSGIAVECGQWSAQYALNSTNPAIGTSWVDITVMGCPTT